MTIVSRIASEVHLMLRRPPRQQYAALCYRQRKKQEQVEVLLITSRDTGRWVIPKGWPMEGKKSHAVAEREAFEEAGVKGKVARDPIGHYSYAKGMEGGLKISCKVQVYPLEVKDMLKDFPEKGTRRAEWVSCEEAAARVQEPELKVLFHRFSQMMINGGAITPASGEAR
ncbi:NUDIX hydrolase [Agrobacterium sp. a22-2]|uniref:NUDIX hydrolase n=1 Tax=Agrobacterium sp. a22-2 TaxID=2283840 RepID=UPI001445C2BC|nr:NUDIX hydrolase [Agrobacterium sp. a22-2]NKN38611.1 NUDIX hydrolase [Agrobacterium sp. a22-2]